VSESFNREAGTISGDYAVEGRLRLSGNVRGNATVPAGATLKLSGMVTRDLVVLAGGTAKVSGVVSGSVLNQGDVELTGVVSGDVRNAPGASFTKRPGAIVHGAIISGKGWNEFEALLSESVETESGKLAAPATDSATEVAFAMALSYIALGTELVLAKVIDQESLAKRLQEYSNSIRSKHSSAAQLIDDMREAINQVDNRG
jgi:cytoskeletal protein CcmA (bactofilin family)